MDARTQRRSFLRGIVRGMRVVWPVVSGLLALIAGLGAAVGRLEGWSLDESLYFAFVSGLTIGYGDFSPKTLFGRLLAIAIGLAGILLTALVAAVAVQALDGVRRQEPR